MNLKIRAPKWVQEFLEDCPNINKNSTYYRTLGQPRVPPASVFINGLASLGDEKERTKIAEKHIVKRIEFLTKKFAMDERDRKEIRMLKGVIADYKNIRTLVPEIDAAEQLDPFQPLWEDTGLMDMDIYEMRKAVSPWSLVERMTMTDNLKAMNRQLDLLAEKMKKVEPDEAAVKDPDYRPSEWLKTVNRNRFYEFNRVGFDTNFQPTDQSLDLYTGVIVQSLQAMVKGVPTGMRSPEVANFVRRADWTDLIKYPELDQNSSEFWLMREYLKAGGLKRVTMNLGMESLSSNLLDKITKQSKANYEDWRNLLLYRLIGQVKTPKITVDLLIGLSLAYQTPVHKILLHQYDLAVLLGRRTVYLPNVDKVHAYLEVATPALSDMMEGYLVEYMDVYMQNIQRIPSTSSRWDAQLRLLMQKSELHSFTSVMAVIKEIVMGNPDTQHLIEEFDNRSRGTLNPVYDVGQLDDLEENYDDLEELEEDDEENENQIQRIQKLLGDDIDKLEPEPQPKTVDEDPNAVPHQPKPQWDWD